MKLVSIVEFALRIAESLKAETSRLTSATAPVPVVVADGEAPNGAPGIHHVQHGDTLWQIATRYGVSPYALLVANPQLLPPMPLVPGEQLQVPAMAGCLRPDLPHAPEPVREPWPPVEAPRHRRLAPAHVAPC